ncbi:hypothetical protein L0P23_20975, partial [Eubacterium callanderi]|uniref:hypothetical protein n=1 Tax=Eubacterium callanderi TaxID=53442 RepID=UPI001EDD77BC
MEPRPRARIEPGGAHVDDRGRCLDPHVYPALDGKLADAHGQDDELRALALHYSSGMRLASAIASAAGLAILRRVGRFIP